jgi:tetratricopeptide (TPR) repeat protein
VIDPEFGLALELADQVRAAFEEEHLRTWLTEARTELRRGGLTAASLLVDRALSLNSSSPEAIAVRAEVDAARRTLAEQDEHARMAEVAIENARPDSGHLEGTAWASERGTFTPTLTDVVDRDAATINEPQATAAARSSSTARVRVASLVVAGVGLVVLLGVIAMRSGVSSRSSQPPPAMVVEPQRPAASASPAKADDAGTPAISTPPPATVIPPSPVTTQPPPRDPDPNQIVREHIDSGNRALEANGDLDVAAREYAEALRLAPGNGEARRGLERARTLKAAPIVALLTRANRVLEEDGDVDGAVALVGDALRLDPANAAAKALAKRLQDLKRIESRP